MTQCLGSEQRRAHVDPRLGSARTTVILGSTRVARRVGVNGYVLYVTTNTMKGGPRLETGGCNGAPLEDGTQSPQ
jgi:hypothetical protein